MNFLRTSIHRLIIIVAILGTGIVSHAQGNETVRNYIATYKDLAIEEMIRTGVPASIKLAQGIHETMAGTSKLVLKSNNHFGIKCKANWAGESVSHDDDARGECFRKYPEAINSYRDHSNFLKNSSRYASLFELDPMDYEGWANGLKKAGYATNPKYPLVLIRLIEDYQLQDYTLIALGKKPQGNEELAKQTGTIEPQTVANTQTIEEVIAPSVPTPSYPPGVFSINETKVIYASKGTSFLSIAQEYNISLARIFEFNEIAEQEAVAFDQLIYIQRKRKSGNGEYHVVKPNETLHDIAQDEAIRLETLLEYNFLTEDQQPAPGERLSLRRKSPAKPRLVLKENYSINPASQRRASN